MTKRTAPMQCRGFSVQVWELNAKNKNILHLPGTGSQNKSRLREKQKELMSDYGIPFPHLNAIYIYMKTFKKANGYPEYVVPLLQIQPPQMGLCDSCLISGDTHYIIYDHICK